MASIEKVFGSLKAKITTQDLRFYAKIIDANSGKLVTSRRFYVLAHAIEFCNKILSLNQQIVKDIESVVLQNKELLKTAAGEDGWGLKE